MKHRLTAICWLKPISFGIQRTGRKQKCIQIIFKTICIAVIVAVSFVRKSFRNQFSNLMSIIHQTQTIKRTSAVSLTFDIDLISRIYDDILSCVVSFFDYMIDKIGGRFTITSIAILSECHSQFSIVNKSLQKSYCILFSVFHVAHIVIAFCI